MYCECGCGRIAPLARDSQAKKGLRRGQPQRFIHGHNRQRRRNLSTPIQFCACGCGEVTAINRDTGAPRLFIASHNLAKRPVGQDHPQWKGGTTVQDGYLFVRSAEHPNAINGYVKRAVLVVERLLDDY